MNHPGLNQRIIENYRALTNTVRQDYLQYLTAKTEAYALGAGPQAEPTTARNVKAEMRGYLERIFQILEAYAVEINRVNRLKDLTISMVSPSEALEVFELDRLRRPSKTASFYRCRFSTRQLSLVVRGLDNRIDFFLLPADRVIGLSRAEEECGALMTFSAGEAAADWQVENKTLSDDRLERYSLLALEHLLDSTQELATTY